MRRVPFAPRLRGVAAVGGPGGVDMCCLNVTAVQTGNYSARTRDFVRVDPGAAGADVGVLLPTPRKGEPLAVTLVNGWGSGYAVVLTSVTGLIGGRASQTLRSVGEVLSLIGDGVNWLVVEWAYPDARPNQAYVLGSGGPSSVAGLLPAYQSKMGQTAAACFTDVSGNGRNLASAGGGGLPARAIGDTQADTGFLVTGNPRGTRTDVNLLATGEVTCEALVRLTSVVSTTMHLIGCVGNPASGGVNNFNYAFALQGSGGPTLFWQNGAAVVNEVVAARALEPGRLHHLVAVRGGPGLKTVWHYLDGELVNTADAANAADGGTSGVFYQFADPAAGGQFINHIIYEAAFYKYAWTEGLAKAMARVRLGTGELKGAA